MQEDSEVYVGLGTSKLKISVARAAAGGGGAGGAAGAAPHASGPGPAGGSRGLRRPGRLEAEDLSGAGRGGTGRRGALLRRHRQHARGGGTPGPGGRGGG